MRWCILCARLPKAQEDVFEELTQKRDLLNVAKCLFSLKFRRRSPVCNECLDTLTSIAEFQERIQKVQKELSKFRSKIPEEEEILQLRKGLFEGPSENWEDELVVDNVVYKIGLKVEEPEQMFVDIVEEDDGMEKYLIEEEEVEIEIPEEAEDDEQVEEEATQNTSKSKNPKKKCRYCPKKFRTDWYHRAHERSHENVAPGQLPYSCEDCGKRFRALSQLNAHIVVHSDDTPYKCNECNRGFKNATRLRIHQESHSDRKWICPLCGLALSSSHSYNKHKFVHSDIRRYQCPICPKTFKKQTALKEHLISHLGLRPYRCPFCEKSFSSGSSCRLHKVKTHPKELAELEASGKIEEVNASHRNLPSLEDLKVLVVEKNSATASEGNNRKDQ